MKNKKIIIGVVIAIVVVVILAVMYVANMSDCLEVIDGPNNSANVQNETDLELTGEEYTPSKIYNGNNEEVDLSQFSDKPMIILFFNSSELESCEAIEILQKYYDTYKEKVNFVNIAIIDGVTETKENIEEYINSNSITMPVLYDTDYSAKNEYEINTIPTLVCINKNNEIINTVSEDLNADVIEANLDILAENY